MEFHRRSLNISVLLFFALSLAACAEKSSNTVFPESTALSSECGADALKTEFLVTWADGHLSRESAPSAEAFKNNFISPQLARIEHVEFNKRIRLHQDMQARVNDSSAEFSPNAINNWGQDISEASAAWSQNIKGSGVMVAVTDTLIDLNHTQLASRIYTNEAELNGQTGIDDDGNGFVDDIHGWDFLHNRPHELGTSGDAHGSHVAGIIAADHNRGPVHGMAPEATLLPVAFLSEEGEGDLYGAVHSVDYAVKSGAKVINASWGGSNCSETLRQAMKRASDAGVLMAVASGNDGVDLETRPDYPAYFNLPTQITVASIRSNGYMSRFSNTSYKYVNIAAPGEEIYSTVPINRVGSMSGTSMATPFVSGAAALLWSYKPAATAIQVRSALLQSVEAGNYRVETQGRLNIRKALLALQGLLTP